MKRFALRVAVARLEDDRNDLDLNIEVDFDDHARRAEPDLLRALRVGRDGRGDRREDLVAWPGGGAEAGGRWVPQAAERDDVDVVHRVGRRLLPVRPLEEAIRRDRRGGAVGLLDQRLDASVLAGRLLLEGRARVQPREEAGEVIGEGMRGHRETL
jgi:hypothetical protein